MVYLALLVAFAVAVHTIEAAIPVPIPVPGVKLGLANIITLLTLLFYGLRSGLLVASLRTVIGSLLIGNFLGPGFYLSFSGAVSSALVMGLALILCRTGKISLISVSVAGAVIFNVVQLSLASLLVQNFILFRGYLPVMLLLAIPTGIFTGAAAIFLGNLADRVGIKMEGQPSARGGPASGR